MVTQKDWIIYDLEHGDLFCLSIARHTEGKRKRRNGGQWFLVRYANYFNLDAREVEEILGEVWGYMIESSKNSDDYTHSISRHSFLPEDMNLGYWKGLLRSKRCFDVRMEGVKFPVNRKNLERELFRLGV